jgi:bifunctional DNase/RNase
MELTEVEVMRLGLDRSTNSYVVILKEKSGNRLLPIWIGQPEAESIVIEINRIKRDRPLTHDLCKSLIIGLGGTLRRVNITKVQDRTYFAELHIAGRDGIVHVDARPSDSIAVALRFSAPIFAQDSLLNAVLIQESGEVDDEDDQPTSFDASLKEREAQREQEELNAEQLKAYLENLRPEDFGKFNL